MSDAPKLYVTLQDIADIAKVGRSAVGNWRKRHPDFPLPNSSDRFDLDEVERWLIARGKISERAPRDFMLWQLADELRGRASPSQTWRFVIASLVYLEACERSERAHADPQRAVIVSEEHTWALVRHTPDAELSSGLLAAVRSVEAANPQLEGVIAPGLDLARHLDPSVVRSLLDALEEATADPTTSRVALFEEAVNRGRDADRFTGEFSTPDDVTELMARLGGQPLGTIFDPAVGEGGLLLTAALRADLNGGKRSRLVGFELNEDVTRVTRARFFLYEFDVELHHVDAFRVPADGLPEAALALVDPPLGQMDWGDADIYLDRRWTHGVPPPKRADLAWLQLAVASLAPGGRAVVTTSPTALSAGGREAAIRSSLLASGLVIAVILLPSRLRANTSSALALWVLRAPGAAPAESVLLVDAGQLGETGRSLHSMGENDIERVVSAVANFEADPSQPPSDGAIAWTVRLNELEEANLDPTRYRPVVEVDVSALANKKAVLLTRLNSATAELDVAVAAVLRRLGSGQ